MFKLSKDKEFYKTFFKIALPVMFSTLITNIVMMADNFMIGQFSNTAVSAVYSVNQVSFVFNILIFGIMLGSGIYVQQFYGAKDKEGLRQAFHFKIIIITILLAIFIPLLYVFGKDLINLYSKNDSSSEIILEEAWKYMSIVLFSYIPFAYMAVFLTTLEETGHTNIPIYSSITSLVINITLNAILINGVGEMKPMGVVGAAIATFIARICEFLMIVIISFIKKFSFTKNFFNFRISPALVKNILVKSWPVMLNELLWSLGMTVTSLAYSTRGNVLSALSIQNTAGEIFNIIFNGFATGIGVMVGHKLGKGDLEGAKEESKKLISLAFVTGVIVSLILLSLSPVIPMMFSEVNEEQKTLAMYLIMVNASCISLFATFSSFFIILKAGGKTYQAFIVDACLTWTIAIPLAFILVKFTLLPLPLIMFLVYAVDMIKIGVGYFLYKRGGWLQNITKFE